MNYEKLVDGSFVREQMGTPKRKESFRKAIASIWKVLNAKYGLMRIDFNEPIALKELVKSFKDRKQSIARPIPKIGSAKKLLSRHSINSAYGIEVDDKHRVLVDNIARHVVYDSTAAQSIMSTNIVSYLLLNKYRKGATMNELIYALDELREELGPRRDFAFDDVSEDVIRTAVELLGDELIECQKNGTNDIIYVQPVLNIPNVIETFYYSTTFLPHIALDAAIVVGVTATLNELEDCDSLAMCDVIDATILYCDVLRNEFIYCKPCQNMNEQIELAVARLCKLGILNRIVVNDGDEYVVNGQLAQTLISSMTPLNLTYWLTSVCLRELFERSRMLENDFIKLCLQHITNQFNSGSITYGEAISTDSIKNCLKLLQKWNITEVDVQSGVRIISLSSLYNSMNAINNVVEKVERYAILK